nr:hypothetical protein WG70_01385 [Burkholderia oklahomensis EO147]
MAPRLVAFGGGGRRGLTLGLVVRAAPRGSRGIAAVDGAIARAAAREPRVPDVMGQSRVPL